ncbi:MAG: hypothetical protein ACE5PM_04575 [Candidatus Hydrothermarchaeales archaeon]
MSGVGDLGKIPVGLLLMLVGVAWYFVKVPILSDVLSTGALVPFWRSLLVAFAGVFGILIFFKDLTLT